MAGRTYKTKHATNLVNAMLDADAFSMGRDDLHIWLATRTNDVARCVIVELVTRNLITNPKGNQCPSTSRRTA